MYSALSKFYDKLMTDFDYDKYAAFLKSKPLGRKGLDLACGSGEMTLRLKAQGHDMTGADVSSEMLTAAAEKARKAHRNVRFLYADLNSLEIAGKYDFITSVCDGFNYIENEEKLANAVCAVRNALNDGGIFVFDISTDTKLTDVIGSNVFYEDNDDLTYFWQTEDKGGFVDMDLTFFRRRPDGSYERSDESQTQYKYSSNKIAAALEKAGFKYTFYNGEFTPFCGGDSRLVVFAVK